MRKYVVIGGILLVIGFLIFIIKAPKTSAPIIEESSNPTDSTLVSDDATTSNLSTSTSELSKPKKIDFTIPESSPAHTATLPDKSYLLSRMFSNYKSTSTVTYFPISESESWKDFGFQGVIYNVVTNEACHTSTLVKAYTNKKNVSGGLFTGTDAFNNKAYKSKNFQIDFGNKCYHFGGFEERDMLRTTTLSDVEYTSKTQNQTKASSRLDTLITTLINSVTIH